MTSSFISLACIVFVDFQVPLDFSYMSLLQMVQQTIDSKSGEHGLGNADNNLSTHDKHFPLVVKKTALRDVQNENRIPKSVGNSPLSKYGGKTMNGIKVSGAKRPSSEDLMYRPVPCYESSTSGAPNFRLVYARGKSEAEVGKLSHPEETAQPKRLQIESTVSTFPALVPLPVAPPIISSGKPSVPLPLGQSSTFSPAESSYLPVGSIVPSSNPKGEKNMHWEERYHQLQISLKKSDESDLDEYVQMLQSVSSVELSKHAIEVEKRSIQLSLEEGNVDFCFLYLCFPLNVCVCVIRWSNTTFINCKMDMAGESLHV
uniref:Uncharacterized protein n=1 Tax=Populus davidiana TaxID=266767 RepID=A0A6M2F6L1_9ROSI